MKSYYRTLFFGNKPGLEPVKKQRPAKLPRNRESRTSQATRTTPNEAKS